MYIMTGDGKQIINSEYVERFCAVKKSDAALIVASYSDIRPPVTLARYKDIDEAQSTLEELLTAMAGGQSCYTMPESRLFFEEKVKKDARTKRKGSS